MKEFALHSHDINALHMSRGPLQETILISGSNRNNLKAWNVDGQRTVSSYSLSGHCEVLSLHVTKEDQLVVCGDDGVFVIEGLS